MTATDCIILHNSCAKLWLHTLFLEPPFLLVTAVLGLTLLAPSGDVMYCVRGVGTTCARVTAVLGLLTARVTAVPGLVPVRVTAVLGLLTARVTAVPGLVLGVSATVRAAGAVPGLSGEVAAGLVFGR